MKPNKAMDKNIRVYIVTALIAGLSVTLIAYLVEIYYGRKYKDEILRLSRTISELKDEVSTLRGQARIRRVTRRENGVVDTRSSEHITKVETDDEDEFFDISSDDDERLDTQDGGSGDTLSFFEQVDDLMKGSAGDHEKALSLLMQCSNSYKDNIDFLWRVAKVYRLKASTADGAGDKEGMKKYIEDGLEYGKKAVEIDPTNGDANKWYAILLGMRNEFLATKQKIENGMMFKNHLEIALDKKPTDFSLYYLLASFKYEVARLSWFEKKAAATLFGALPDVTADDAFNDASQAEKLSPEPWADNRVLLAKCCFAKGDNRTGVTWLKKARDVLTDLPQNKVVKNEVEALLSKYNKYSS